MRQKLVVLFLLLCSHFGNSSIFDTIRNYYCGITECCNEKTVPYKLKSLQTMLEKNLYGQHIATEVVLNAILSHVTNSKSKNPLVMSFHGSNGVGKSYVSRMIARALYKKGEDSKYFHFYYGLQNFPEIEKISEYKKQLSSEIEASIKSCERSLFIFDGVDYFPPGFLDVLMPFIDCTDCGIKFQEKKSIFILLSNAGSGAIEQKLLERLRSGTKRESTSLQDFEKAVISEAYSADGPFYKSQLIKANSINFYVPFLPLEREHVAKCIKIAFKELKVWPTEDLVNMVFQEIRFGTENLFSNGGCKRVELIVGRVNAKVNHLIDDFDSNDEL